MKECPFCQMIKNDRLDNLILENEYALVTAGDYFREGQCTVIMKDHIVSVSQMNKEQYIAAFDLVTKISKALEKKYNCEGTYLLSIGDQVRHLHFHLIPKHKDKCSMGIYCFGSLFKEEGERKPTQEEQNSLAYDIKELLLK